MRRVRSGRGVRCRLSVVLRELKRTTSAQLEGIAVLPEVPSEQSDARVGGVPARQLGPRRRRLSHGDVDTPPYHPRAPTTLRLSASSSDNRRVHPKDLLLHALPADDVMKRVSLAPIQGPFLSLRVNR